MMEIECGDCMGVLFSHFPVVRIMQLGHISMFSGPGNVTPQKHIGVQWLIPYLNGKLWDNEYEGEKDRVLTEVNVWALLQATESVATGTAHLFTIIFLLLWRWALTWRCMTQATQPDLFAFHLEDE